jgi:hypothetical protein
MPGTTKQDLQAERLQAIRLRYTINTYLEDHGTTMPAAIGAATGLPTAEAVRLLTAGNGAKATCGAQGGRRPAWPRRSAGEPRSANAGGKGPMTSVPVPVPKAAMPDWPAAAGERALRQALGYIATADAPDPRRVYAWDASGQSEQAADPTSMAKATWRCSKPSAKKIL